MNLKTRMIEFSSNGGTTPGYLAMPSDDAAHPGVVVIQEWWGLVPHIKEVAERFAREGFIALAPDLYHGQIAVEPDEARKLAMALERARAVAEIQAAANFLSSLENVTPRKIGVVGFCMGGGLALSTAAEGAPIGAAIAFYGRPLDVNDTARLRVPVLGLYGELDQGIPVEKVRAFKQELAQWNVPHEIVIYPNAPHAFFNNTRPSAYHAISARDAWSRSLAWFRRYLG